MPPTHDYHVHSTYSDGSDLAGMVRAASEAGVEAIGFADHCNVSERASARAAKYRNGFNLDATYERRRHAIESLREEADVRIFDAAEMDYDPRDEADIREFLDAARFDYVVGSVHELDGENVHAESHFAAKSGGERRELVERYFEKTVSLIESELFDVAAHVDLVERNPALRGFSTDEQFDRLADAFADSRTVPEVNAGRVLDEYGEFHPAPTLFDALRDRGIPFVVGSDSHSPGELKARADVIGELSEARGLDFSRLDAVAGG